MKLAVIANEELKAELLAMPLQPHTEIIWFEKASDLVGDKEPDGIIDLLFSGTANEINLLNTLLPRPVIVNSVCHTLQQTNPNFIRINAWPGFLKRSIAELAIGPDENKEKAEKIMAAIGRKAEWVPDIPGFISPRVIAMIINEAYFALEEKVSTKEEIDTAMKLGTNYPYGPFEWAGKIGIKNIYTLLQKMAETESRYQPAPLLEKDATGN